MCDEIIKDADCVSANVPANVTSTALTNFPNKKVGYQIHCFVLQTFLLVIILLFILPLFAIIVQNIGQN